MPSPSPPAIIGMIMLAASSGAASAQALSDAATHAPPQHYVITLPPTPVAEVAEVVLGESLGLPFKVDADVKAEMAFRVDGVYAPEDLAREFGYRLWNVDVVLIERPADGLWLIPRAELAAAVAAGAQVVSPLASTPGSGSATVATAAPAARVDVVTSPERDLGWLWGGLAGWIAGVASTLALVRLKGRNARPATGLLSAPVAEPAPGPTVDDLTIPTFSDPRPGPATTVRQSDP